MITNDLDVWGSSGLPRISLDAVPGPRPAAIPWPSPPVLRSAEESRQISRTSRRWAFGPLLHEGAIG